MHPPINRTIPKLRWLRIIPAAILVYIFSFMDRTNISFAMAGGMNESLGLTAQGAGLAAGIFFLGYVCLQTQAGHWAERGNAKRFIGISILFWGGLSVLCGFVRNPVELLVIRFLTGVAEGGVWPAMLVIISHWFPNEERGRANACFVMNIAIASIITGPLSGWIVADYGWRWVFIGEGVLSLALVLIWYPLIANSPQEARWLSAAERDYITTRIAVERVILAQKHGPVSYRAALRQGNLWKLVALYFCYQVGIYGFAMWLPTLIKGLTSEGMANVGLLSAVPYIAMIGGVFMFGYFSDRHDDRRLYVAIPIFGFAVCFVLSTLFERHIWVSYAFLVGCGFFMQSASGVFWAIPPMLFPPEVAGGMRGVINALGNLGGFIGPFAVGSLRAASSGYDLGIDFLAVMLMAGFFIALSLPRASTTQTGGFVKPSP